MIHFPKVIINLKAAAFRNLFLRAIQKRVLPSPARNFGRFFEETQFFACEKLRRLNKKSFKIVQRYLLYWEGNLSFARKNKDLKVVAMVVDNCQQEYNRKLPYGRKERNLGAV